MPVAHRQTLVAPTGPLLLYVSLPLLALPRSESYPVTDVPLSQGQSTQAHPLPALATQVMHPPASAHSCGRSNNCLETELKTQTRLSGGWGEVLWRDSRSSLPFAVPLQCISVTAPPLPVLSYHSVGQAWWLGTSTSFPLDWLGFDPLTSSGIRCCSLNSLYWRKHSLLSASKSLSFHQHSVFSYTHTQRFIPPPAQYSILILSLCFLSLY